MKWEPIPGVTGELGLIIILPHPPAPQLPGLGSAGQRWMQARCSALSRVYISDTVGHAYRVLGDHQQMRVRPGQWGRPVEGGEGHPEERGQVSSCFRRWRAGPWAGGQGWGGSSGLVSWVQELGL